VRRGDIWLVNLDPVMGSEANKTRPCVVVSNDHANTRASMLDRGTVTVVPVTSTVEPLMAFHTFLPSEATGLDHDSKAQAEQVRTIDFRRLRRQIGRTTPELLRNLDSALRLHLDL